LALVAISSTNLLRGEGALVALDAAGEERWRWAPGVQRVSAPMIVRSDDFSRSDADATEVATTSPMPVLVRSDDFSRSDADATEVAATNATYGLEHMVCCTADAWTLVVLDLTTGVERARVELEANVSLSAPALVDGVRSQEGECVARAANLCYTVFAVRSGRMGGV
jgi:hypothetical protein